MIHKFGEYKGEEVYLCECGEELMVKKDNPEKDNPEICCTNCGCKELKINPEPKQVSRSLSVTDILVVVTDALMAYEKSAQESIFFKTAGAAK